MKKTLFFFTLLANCYTMQAQLAGINNNAPGANAVPDIKQTTDKGLLIPRGNVATRNALNANTAKGLMIYDTTTYSLWIHNGNGNAACRAQQQFARGTLFLMHPAML